MQLTLGSVRLPLSHPTEQSQRAKTGDEKRQPRGKRNGRGDERTGVGKRPIDSGSRSANLVRVHNRKSILIDTGSARKGARQH